MPPMGINLTQTPVILQNFTTINLFSPEDVAILRVFSLSRFLSLAANSSRARRSSSLLPLSDDILAEKMRMFVNICLDMPFDRLFDSLGVNIQATGIKISSIGVLLVRGARPLRPMICGGTMKLARSQAAYLKFELVPKGVIAQLFHVF